MSYQGESGWPPCANCGHAHPDGECRRMEWSYKDQDYQPCGCEHYDTGHRMTERCLVCKREPGERVTTGSEPSAAAIEAVARTLYGSNRLWEPLHYNVQQRYRSRARRALAAAYDPDVTAVVRVLSESPWFCDGEPHDLSTLARAVVGVVRERTVEVVEPDYDERATVEELRAELAASAHREVAAKHRINDLERAVEAEHERTVKAVVEEVDRWYHGKPPIHKPLLEHLAEHFNIEETDV